jgi:DNA-binding NarL/FixJ family response regulator
MWRIVLSYAGVASVVLLALGWSMFLHGTGRLATELLATIVGTVTLFAGLWAGRAFAGRSVGIQLDHRHHEPASTQHGEDVGGLTDREREVLVLIADGKSNAEIAATLFVSINTVKTHVTNIYAKLGVRRRTEAVLVAGQRGIIALPHQPKG